jgi:hypothetical protein
MEIKYAMSETVPFEKVGVGDTFEHTGNVYIRLERVYISKDSTGHTYNAVNLNTAELVCIPSDMTVRPVRATLTIS